MTSLTLAAVVMTLSGVPRPSQIRWCLLPVFRRSTGDGPVSAPPFSRGCGSRPRTHGTSRVRRPRSARRAGPGAAGRRPLPSATAPGAASRSARSRTPAPAAAVARLCRCRARTGCPADTAGPTPAAAPEPSPARAAAAARSAPTSHRPRSTAEYSHHPERPNHHTGHARPETFNKIVLRARSRVGRQLDAQRGPHAGLRSQGPGKPPDRVCPAHSGASSNCTTDLFARRASTLTRLSEPAATKFGVAHSGQLPPGQYVVSHPCSARRNRADRGCLVT